MDQAQMQARFAETDRYIEAVAARIDELARQGVDRHATLADAVDQRLDDMDAKLDRIAAQNSALADMVEVLGSYVNAATDVIQTHVQGHD